MTMATTYANPRQRARLTATAAGALYLDHQKLDLADPKLELGELAADDAIQIAVVPAGHVLEPAFSSLDLPALDTGTGGTASIGTAEEPDGLADSASVTAASSKGLGELASPEAPIGSPYNDTPIVLTYTAAPGTQAKEGVVHATLALRAWDEAIDGNY
jgi:hypothetical protein